jgi:hypothetical protein
MTHVQLTQLQQVVVGSEQGELGLWNIRTGTVCYSILFVLLFLIRLLITYCTYIIKETSKSDISAHMCVLLRVHMLASCNACIALTKHFVAI